MTKSALALASALSLLAPPASAATRLSVLTFAPLSGDLPNGAGDKAADLLAGELASIGDLDVAPRPRRIEGLARDELATAKKTLAAARAALAGHQPAEAQRDYEAARAGFTKALAALDDFQDLLDCTAELGALQYRRGEDDAGRASLREALRLAAGRPIQAIAQAPSFSAEEKKLAREAAALPRGAIRIDSTPEGAEVWVDGEDVGKAPVLVRDLPRGPQYLRAVLPSGELWGQVADAAPGSTPLRVRAQSGAEGPAAELNAELAENRIEPQALDAAAAAAKAGAAALVVFGSLHRTPDGLALDAFLYDAAKKTVSRLPRVSFDTEMLDARLQMDKIVTQIHARQTAGGPPLVLPARVAADRIAEGTLASEFRFGGAGTEGDASTPPPSSAPRRVVVHGHGP